MHGAAAIESALKVLGATPDDAFDVAEAALLLAALDRPEADLTPYRRHLTEITGTLARLETGADVGQRALALAGVIGGDFGYRGDTESYDDPANADLMQVIDRRMGLPVALGILYLHGGRAMGWPVVGLDFPGHFLIRVAGEDSEGESATLVLDPFHGGRIADAAAMTDLLRRIGGGDELGPQHVRPMTGRAVLLRLLNNTKARAWRARDADRTAQMLERMLLVAPDFAPAWRELGMVEEKRGRIRQAITATERYLMLGGDEAAALEAQAFLRHIRLQLN